MSDEEVSEGAESAEEQVAEDQWDFYFQTVDGAPASIMLDFSFDGYAPMEGFSKLTMVFVDMEAPGENGLGDQGEADGFEAVEAALHAGVEALGCYFVGRARTGSQWHLSFYGPADVDAEAAASGILEEQGRDHSTVSQDDPEWNYYTQFLIPSAERRRWMGDRNVVQALAGAGDDGTKTRAIDHFVMFRTTQQRQAFVSSAKEAGFTTINTDEEEGEWKHSVKATRKDTANLEHIHTVTMSVTKMAEECEGWYDGWGCPPKL